MFSLTLPKLKQNYKHIQKIRTDMSKNYLKWRVTDSISLTYEERR